MTTTAYDVVVGGKVSTPAGINMSCVLEYNAIAKDVAEDVGGITIIDLWQAVEDFCSVFPQADPAKYPAVGDNYTSCAVQTTGLHFYNTKYFNLTRDF